MKYNFDEYVERRGTYSMKWDAGEMIQRMGLTKTFDENTIPIFTADMDFPCPQPVIDALHKVVDQRIFGYTSQNALPDYNNAIIRWFRDRHQWEIDPEWISYVDGTVTGVNVAIRAFSEPGDGVLITRPIYGPFTSAIVNNGRRVVNSQLLEKDGYYTMDFADIEAKAKDPSVKIFILCSPHNPSGRVWTKEELQTLADICQRNDVVLVSDEVHCDLIRRGNKHYPIAAVADNQNIVMLTALNKTFNTAGLKCSNAIIANPDLRARYKKAGGHKSASPFTIAALVAAYTQGDEWLEQIIDYIDGNIDWAIDFLHTHMPKVKCRRPEGTYVLWMDFRDYGLTPEEIHEKIYEKANVLLEGGKMFDPDQGAGYERVCLSSPRPLLEEAFTRIAREFEGL